MTKRWFLLATLALVPTLGCKTNSAGLSPSAIAVDAAVGESDTAYGTLSVGDAQATGNLDTTSASSTALDGAPPTGTSDAVGAVDLPGTPGTGGIPAMVDGGLAASGGAIAPRDGGTVDGLLVLFDTSPLGDARVGTGGSSGADARSTGGAIATGGVVPLPDAGGVGGSPATGGVVAPADSGVPDTVIATGGSPADASPDLPPPPPDTQTVPDAPALKLVWFDEFDGEANTHADGEKWTYLQWEPGSVNNEIQRYTNRVENAFLDGDGHLVIHPQYNPAALQSSRYTSARLETSDGKYSFLGGRIEVRAKLPSGKGSFPGILLLGTRGPWPTCGELALVEQWGQDKIWCYATAYASTEAEGDSGHAKYTFASPTAASSEFHTYALDWNESNVVFYVDGDIVLKKSFNQSSPFAQIPANIVLDVALGGNMGGTVDNTAFADGKMDMVVDFVRVYQP